MILRVLAVSMIGFTLVVLREQQRPVRRRLFRI